MLVSSEIKVL